MKRFELSTLSLARRCSTTELHPQADPLRNPVDSSADLLRMHYRVPWSQQGGVGKAAMVAGAERQRVDRRFIGSDPCGQPPSRGSKDPCN